MKKQALMMAAAGMCAALALDATAQNAAPVPAAAPAPAVPAAPAAKPTLNSVLAFLPETVAEAGAVKITKNQLIQMLNQQQIPAEAFGQIPADQLKGVLRDMVEGLLDTEVLLQAAQKAGVQPTPDLVNAAFDKMLATLPPDRKEMFSTMLKQRGKTLEQYKAELAKDKGAQQGIAIQKWVDEFIANKAENQASDADAEKFYRENQDTFKMPEMVDASHILYAVPTMDKDNKPLSKEVIAKNDAEAKQKAEDALAKIKQGANFAELAEKESACPSGKNAKGSLGKFPRGRMDKAFENAAFALNKKGEVSGVVKSAYGYHIIKLNADKIATGFQPLSEVKAEIVNYLKQQKVKSALQSILTKEKANLKVKIYGLDEEKPAAAAPAAPAAK